MRSRDGYSTIAPANAATIQTGPFAWRAAGKLLVTGAVPTKFYLFDVTGAGALLATSASAYGPVASVAEFGTGTTSYLYAGLSQSASRIVRIDSSNAFTQPASMPAADWLKVQPVDNRLVAASIHTLPSGSSAAAASSSLVHFSEPGDAETWSPNNWELLTPNDGQSIRGTGVWGNQVFVFKDRKFFVFYGNSTDNDGNPVFNYRAIDTGVGLALQGGPVISAPDGLYFGGQDGLYKTTGGPPVKVSTALDPLFRAGPAPPYLGLATGAASFWLRGVFFEDRIYTVILRGATFYALVYDIPTQNWMVWQPNDFTLNGGGFALIEIGASQVPRICFGSGTQLYAFDKTATTDNGVGITSRYRSGFTPLNWIRRSGRWYPIGSQEATVRESVIDGTGTIKFSVSRDFGAVPTTGGGAKATVTLGVSPAVAQGRHIVSQQGRRVSFQIEDDGTGSAWRVYDLTMHIADARYPGVETS